MGGAALVVLLLALAACGGDDPEVSDDLEQQVTELEQDVEDLGEQLDQAEAQQRQEEMDAYLDCYHDPDTERLSPNLPVPAPGECPEPAG